ncbi:MAG: ACT domain-containing protein [Actinomycetota bacterium]|nr:ACT domain-containing protein [Actinomycetota bacterium]
MGHFAVTAIGEDRPGIVAGLTGALHDLGGNLADVSSTILRGHFAMMFVVDAPRETDAEHLWEALVHAAEPLGVAVTVRDVEAGPAERPHATHSLVVYGSDRPGIVARFTRLLADRRVNITDLSCRLVEEEDEPVYAMVAELALLPDVDAVDLAAEVEKTGGDLDVDVTFRPIDIDTF